MAGWDGKTETATPPQQQRRNGGAGEKGRSAGGRPTRPGGLKLDTMPMARALACHCGETRARPEQSPTAVAVAVAAQWQQQAGRKVVSGPFALQC